MRVYDKESELFCTVSIAGEFKPVVITGNKYMVDVVTEYLSRGAGWGGQSIEIGSTTMYDVVTCLGGNSDWLLVDVPELLQPDVPEGAIG